MGVCVRSFSTAVAYFQFAHISPLYPEMCYRLLPLLAASLIFFLFAFIFSFFVDHTCNFSRFYQPLSGCWVLKSVAEAKRQHW